jgi:hypothetical protein
VLGSLLEVSDLETRILKHKISPVRTEPVEVPSVSQQGFNRVSPNGEGLVFCLIGIPIVLSLSKGRLSPIGVGGVAKKMKGVNSTHIFL